MRTLTCSLALVAASLLSSRPALADDKEVRDTLEKAIKAHGGADKLNKHLASTGNMKGKVHVMETTFEFTGEIASQAPDKLKVTIEFEAGGMAFKVIQVFNKDKGWASLNNTVMEMDKDQLAEAREELHASEVTNRLTPLLDKEYKLSSLGEVKVNEKPATGIQVTRKGYRDMNLYFDKKTNLLVKTERRVRDDMSKQEMTQEEFLEDHKDISGLMVPQKLKIKRDGKDFLEGEMTDYKILEKLPDDTFAKP